MHHLHPRSRTTSTLFTTTLAISFLVVSLPHLLPCPVDRRQFADTIEMPDGTIKRRRRRQPAAEDSDNAVAMEGVSNAEDGRPKRECPVPKPGGLVGQIMGFDKKEKERPTEVIVQTLKTRKAALEDGGNEP